MYFRSELITSPHRCSVNVSCVLGVVGSTKAAVGEGQGLPSRLALRSGRDTDYEQVLIS